MEGSQQNDELSKDTRNEERGAATVLPTSCKETDVTEKAKHTPEMTTECHLENVAQRGKSWNAEVSGTRFANSSPSHLVCMQSLLPTS